MCYSVHLSINTLVSRLGSSEGSSGFGKGTYGNQLQYNACTIMMSHFIFCYIMLTVHLFLLTFMFMFMFMTSKQHGITVLQ